MRTVRNFGRFWIDFVVGDDWRIAVWVIAWVTATVVLARRWDVWPLMPCGVTVALAHSLRRATRRAAGPAIELEHGTDGAT